MSNSPEKQSSQLITSWQSPSNIALIKYWGKHGRQLPQNPSISFTLSEARTQTRLELLPKAGTEAIDVQLFFEGQRNSAFEHRTGTFLKELSVLFFPWLTEYTIRIDTSNTFPHSSGIASSASGMSALALNLCNMDHTIRNASPDQESCQKRASLVSRLGSGSACRSVYPKIAAWGEHKDLPESSDMYAIGLADKLHPLFHIFHDDILIISEKEKSVSSSAGHQLMENNPYASARYLQANERLSRLWKSLQQGDLETFITITEEEALTLHALMMCSTPSYMLMEPNTLQVIKRIRSFRNDTGIPVCFTLDAGPNVHVLYPDTHVGEVSRFMDDQLRPLCHQERIIHDKVGDGPSPVALV